MSGIISGIQDLFSSVIEIFAGIFNAILSAFQNVFALAKNILASVFDLLSGAVGFVLGLCCHRVYAEDWLIILGVPGNIVLIGVLIAAFIGYQAYTGKRVGKGKKRS